MANASGQLRACGLLIVGAPSRWRDGASRELASVGWQVSAVDESDDAFPVVYGGGCDVVVFALHDLEDDPAYLRRLFEPMLRTSSVRPVWIQAGEPSATDPRALAALLGPSGAGSESTVSGSLPDDDLLTFLTEASDRSPSGVLTARYADRVVKLVLDAGQLVLCASNDPVDRVGQVCLARRLVREDQLRVALSIQRTSAEPLGLILRGLAHRADVDGALREHYAEVFCELCLWCEGAWEFHDGLADWGARRAGSGAASLRSLLERAAATRKQWGHPIISWHPPEAKVELDRAAGRVPLSASQQRVVEQLSIRRTVEHLRLELRWTRLEIQRALAELEALAVVRVWLEDLSSPGISVRPSLPRVERPTSPPIASRSTAPPPVTKAEAVTSPPEKGMPVQQRVSAARAQMEAGQLGVAREELVAALALQPTHAEALAALSRVDRARLARARAAQLDAGTVLRLNVPLRQIRGLSPSGGFVLSRLEGPECSIEDLLAVCPLPEADILEILDLALENDWLAIQPPPSTRR